MAERSGSRDLEWSVIGESDDLAGAVAIALTDRQRGYHRRILRADGGGAVVWWLAPLS